MNLKGCFCVFFLLGTAFGFTPEQDQPYDGPTMESSQLEMSHSTQGIVEFRLFTDKALYYENGDKTCPEGVYIEFYEAGKRISVIGRANSAYFFAEEDVYAFRGDVEFKSLPNKRQLNTEELHFNPQTQTFYTDKFIRIETEDQMLTGKGLTAKKDFSYYHISDPQGLLNVESIE